MKWFLFIPILISFTLECSSLRKLNLGGEWNLDESNKRFTKLNATVPGGIYTDLLKNKIINDPFLDDNDQSTKWIGRSNWTYYRNFTISKDILEYSNLNIVFEGLDTISTISLNGKLIGKTENMFRRYIFNVKNEIMENNVIEVNFFSPVEKAQEIASKQAESYKVPPDCPSNNYGGECHINELRKMQASFSWDWGPSIASMGIWRDIYIEAFNSNVIRYSVVEMEEIPSKSVWNVSVKTYLSNNVKNEANGKLAIELETDYDTKLKIYKEVNLHSSDMENFEIVQFFEVPQNFVRRWWPNGYGQQSLYNLTTTFNSLDESDSFSQKIGFRTVQLVQDELKTENKSSGNSFYFKVNGVPIFAKGSNAIPLSILPEKGGDKKLIDKAFKTARECNMNMLRVWGGGVYESDYYYQKADESGIMIWQDFMFACALYPTRDNFLSNVISEIQHQVRRISSHPSIVIWAGNNENEAAITGNWYGSNGKEIYNEDYIKLYYKTIKPEFGKLLQKGIYIASSPTNGIKSEIDGGISKNPYDQLYGDVHTYIYELDGFNPNIYPTPRFSSEYGFQSYPSFSTLLKSTNDSSNVEIGSNFLKHRQHHPLGDIQMKLLIFYQLDLPSKNSGNYTEVFIFYSQIIQAVSIKTETEHYRKYRSLISDNGRGLTMGALYWQLNDVWVAPTWSGIDFNGNWKMLQYFIQNVFSPFIIVGHLNPERILEITLVSDKMITVDATLYIYVFNFSSFEPIKNSNQQINTTIESGSSKNVISINADEYLSKFGCGSLSDARKNCFFNLQLRNGNTVIAPENFVLLDKLKNLNLKQPKITILFVEPITETDMENFKITLKSTEIALFVWLDVDGIPGKFSENGFHQITEEKIVYFQSEENSNAKTLKEKLTISNLLSVNKF